MNRCGIRIAGLLVLLAAAFSTAPARGQPAEEPTVSPGEPYYEQARQLYREREYAQALQLLTQAIQADPNDPRYFIGAARAANFSNQLELSVLFYDAYLTNFPDHASSARRRADRLEAVQRERDEANGRRPTPDVPVVLPEQQAAALATLQNRLATGPVMTLDATGAYTMYQTLLRTGYAQPELRELRDALANGILSETHALFWPTPESPVPVAELALWQSIRSRYEAAETLGRPVMTDPQVAARLLTAEGQAAMINANNEIAIDSFRRAAELDPNLLMAHIGLLMALHRYAVRQGCCYDLGGGVDAASVVDRVAYLIELQAPQHAPILPLLQGMIASDTGDREQGAARLIEVLSPGTRVTVGPAPSEPPGTPPPAGQIEVAPGSEVLEGPAELDEPPTPPEDEEPPREGMPPPEL